MEKTNELALADAARLLKNADNILILTHKNPDGDTLGSAFALCEMLSQLNKTVKVSPSGSIPKKYAYMYERFGTVSADAEYSYVVTVDIAAASLTDDAHRPLCERADLAIDHHAFNEHFAKSTYVDAGSASCCEIIYSLLPMLGVKLNRYIAECIYTGLSTDTGCFRYRNTTASSHVTAAELMHTGFDMTALNTLLFEQKSRSRLELERLAMGSIEFYFNDRAAVITITQEMMKKAGAGDNDIEGITPLPRMIEGVEAGITMREQPNGFCKVSVRSSRIDACAVCREFGGGGHRGAAGFECSGVFADVKNLLLIEIKKQLDALDED